MTAILGLVGPHSSVDLHSMGERLRHRGQRSHLVTLNESLSVGAIGQDPESMIFRTDTTVAVAAGSVYSIEGDLPQDESQPNLAEWLLRKSDADGISRLASLNGDFAAAI